MKNKVLAMLLALCMVMSLLPVAVFATDEETGTGTGTTTTPPAEEGEEDEGDEGETGCETCGCAPCTACTESCSCEENPCGAPGCSRTWCTNTLCESYGTVVEKPHTCEAATVPCPVSGCENEKGHEGAHSGENVVCSGDDQCSVSTEGENPEANHQPGCPKLGGIELEEGNELAVYEWEFTPEAVFCACTEENHERTGDENKCENALAGKKMTLSINVVIDTSELDEGMTRQELIDAAGEKATEAVSAAEKTAQDAWEAENEGWYCARCKAAVAEGCTLNADCTAAAHRDDCLSQCTMSSSCTNGAHKVQYVVKEDGAVVGIYNTRADAVAYFNQLRDAAAESEKECELYVGAIHCPKAGVPDGVVVSVNEAGEVVETPETPEIPEKPTKAEEFTDMEDWMAEGVQFALDNGLMEGLGNGRFDGRTKVDAITVATVFARMAGETITGASWKDDAAAWVEENAELFEGIDLEGAELARKDVVLVMWRQAGKPEPADDFELEFTDVEGLEGDHLTAMKWAAGQKIVQGNGDGTANPDGGVSRGELCILLSRAAGEK